MALFIYLWLCCVGATLVAALSLSLWQLVLLWSRGSGACGLSGCGAQALEHRLSTTGAWAYLLLGMWDLPRSGIEPVSPASAGRFFTTETPGKPSKTLLNIIIRKQFNLEQQQRDVKRRYPKENITWQKKDMKSSQHHSSPGKYKVKPQDTSKHPLEWLNFLVLTVSSVGKDVK